VGAEQEDSIREQVFPSGTAGSILCLTGILTKGAVFFIISVFPSVPEKAGIEPTYLTTTALLLKAISGVQAF
jgi:hypothetical protein